MPIKSCFWADVWSRGVARWCRESLSVADPFVCRCLTSSAMLPFPHPAHRTGRADLPHPALGEDSRNRRGHCMRRRLQLLETTWELSGLSPISLPVAASCVRLQLRPLTSTGVTRLRQYYEPLRHPSQPGLSLTSCPLIRTAITAGTSRVAYGPLCLHAVANTPAGRMEFVRSYDSIRFGLPTNRGGSAPALSVSGPAQRSLTLRPARSPSRLATLCTRGFSSFVASTAALIATGWNEPVPGRVYLPLWTTTFSRRTRIADHRGAIGSVSACGVVGR